MLSTGRFYLAPALWLLRPRVPRIYVFRVMLVSLPGAEARARGSPGRVTTLRPPPAASSPRVAGPTCAAAAGLRPYGYQYGYAGSERASGAPTLLRAPAAREAT